MPERWGDLKSPHHQHFHCGGFTSSAWAANNYCLVTITKYY